MISQFFLWEHWHLQMNVTLQSQTAKPYPRTTHKSLKWRWRSTAAHEGVAIHVLMRPVSQITMIASDKMPQDLTWLCAGLKTEPIHPRDSRAVLTKILIVSSSIIRVSFDSGFNSILYPISSNHIQSVKTTFEGNKRKDTRRNRHYWQSTSC